jgi:RNA polymerase sigma factor (sigma-70 family)
VTFEPVGSSHDAEDLLQDTVLAAWRGLEQFEGRSSVRSWLYRIATNRSLDAVRARAIDAFLRGSAERRDAPLRLIPTRANT